MTLRRTAGGIANLCLFFKVDKVVYCEGGRGNVLSIAAILSGQGDENSLDATFWSHVALSLGATKRYHFKSVGNRAVLDSLASDVVSGDIKTVVVCRDSDFGEFLNRNLRHSNLAYTYGYSWENDVCRLPALMAILKSLLPADQATDDLVNAFSAKWRQLSSSLIRWCEVDLNLITKGKGALFVRSTPIGLFDDFSSAPKINTMRARGRLGTLGYRRCPPRKFRLPDSDAVRYACGKTVASLAYHMLVGHIKSRVSTFNISQDAFYRLCISATMERIRLGECGELITHCSSFKAAFD